MEAMSVDDAPSTTTTTTGDTVPSFSSSSTAPNLDGILLLEAPFAKLPFDELRRQQKTQQRLIERELLFASTTFTDSPPAASNADLDRSLDTVLGRLKGLKRKLAPLADSAKTSLRMAQSRTDHLNALHKMTDSDSAEFQEWSRTRLDRMIVDYMLRRGYRGAAEELVVERGLEDLVDRGLFEDVARVEDSLCPSGWRDSEDVKPSCALALVWCSENKATLRKIRTPLEFNLRLQEYIELTRTRTPESLKEAISYARRHLLPLITAPLVKPSSSDSKDAEYERLAALAMRREVSRAMGLLACGPSSWAYSDLYDLSRWSMLRDSFRSCALQIHSLPAQPMLHIALSAGLSSLKLPQCYDTKEEKSTDCPICDADGLGKLAAEVPWSHHQNSTLVCSWSGRVMDGDDPPLVLGNGRVYAQSSVVELLNREQEGAKLIRCPRTGERCSVDEVRKVFIS